MEAEPPTKPDSALLKATKSAMKCPEFRATLRRRKDRAARKLAGCTCDGATCTCGALAKAQEKLKSEEE